MVKNPFLWIYKRFLWNQQLYIASAVGDVNTVYEQVLLRPGTINQKDPYFGATPLFIATQNGHTQIVKLLLQYPKIKPQKKIKNFGVDAFYIACQNGYFLIALELLQSGIKITKSVRPESKISTLDIAAQKNHYSIMKLILRCGFDPNIRSEIRPSALYISASKGHRKCTKLLVESGANCGYKWEDTFSSLGVAATKGHIGCLEVLLPS